MVDNDSIAERLSKALNSNTELHHYLIREIYKKYANELPEYPIFPTTYISNEFADPVLKYAPKYSITDSWFIEVGVDWLYEVFMTGKYRGA